MPEDGGVVGRGASSWLPDGEIDLGVEMSLAILDPHVAAIEGEDGGSGDRVK
jgi:hypothetical protein